MEYRVISPEGTTVWIRDQVHVVRRAQGVRQLRGLMVDITGRKRAEQALRKSERKYSEAFRREREAAQRLRALDEMKNTFLEAVSHDLRTPLTSILGSALTLEQTRFELPRAEALDLVHRVATNARKLERLLTDLLDLDRLQRGIVSPQRRPTEISDLVRRAVDELEDPAAHAIELDVEDVTVSIDAAKVERILENLLSNADPAHACRDQDLGHRVQQGRRHDVGRGRRRSRRAIRPSRSRVRAVPPGAGLVLGAFPGGRCGPVPGPPVLRAARRTGLAGRAGRWWRVLPRVPARGLSPHYHRPVHELIVEGATIVDGSGAASFVGSVGRSRRPDRVDPPRASRPMTSRPSIAWTVEVRC